MAAFGRKQAHDQHHNWIRIRRGLCNRCGNTFTFLPPFSPPYGHYSFIARSQALQRYFLEGRCWEDAAPTVKDPDRVADPSTLRRWFRHLDSSRPPFSALLRETIRAVGVWLARTEVLVHDSLLPLRCAHHIPVSRPVLGPCGFRDAPAAPTILAGENGWLPPTLDSGGENSTMAENLERLKQRIPLLEYLQRHNWKPCRAGTRQEFVGLCPFHQEAHPPLYVNAAKNLFYCHGLRPGRGLDPLCPAIPRSALFHQTVAHLEQELLPAPVFRAAGGDGRFLSVSTAPLSRSCRLSGTSRSA